MDFRSQDHTSRQDTARGCTLKAFAELSGADVKRRLFGFKAELMAWRRRVPLSYLALIGSSFVLHAPFAATVTADAPMSLDGAASRTDPRLPVGAPARIIIRYSSENAVALQRATDLARGLTEQGLDVADLVSSSERIASSTVSYFYLEDRPDAEIAARGLGAAWKPVQQRLPQREPFPRPGALELAVAGP